MKMFCTFLKIELKRVLQTLPKLLIGAATLIILVSGVAFCSGHFLSKGFTIDTIRIGIVVNDDSSWVQTGIDTIASSESTSSIEFVQTDEASAKKMLSNNELIAVLVLPEKFVSSVINGENNPITVLYPANCGLEAVVITELAETAANILSSFQSGIYAADDFCFKYSEVSVSKKINRQLNGSYIKYTLSRELLYNKNILSTCGDVPLVKYYTASGIVLFILFFGITLSSFFASYSRDNQIILRRMGLSYTKQFFSHILCTFAALGIIIAVMSIPALIFTPLTFMEFLILLPATLLCAIIGSVCIVAIFRIIGTGTSGILALSGFTIVTGIISGLFIPKLLLPEALYTIGCFTPTGIMFNLLLSVI